MEWNFKDLNEFIIYYYEYHEGHKSLQIGPRNYNSKYQLIYDNIKLYKNKKYNYLFS